MQKILDNQKMIEAKREFAEQLRGLVRDAYEGNVALFARNLEVDKETVKRWLKGDALPSREMLESIEALLGVVQTDKSDMLEAVYREALLAHDQRAESARGR